jgi:hypothetical protein
MVAGENGALRRPLAEVPLKQALLRLVTTCYDLLRLVTTSRMRNLGKRELVTCYDLNPRRRGGESLGLGFGTWNLGFPWRLDPGAWSFAARYACSTADGTRETSKTPRVYAVQYGSTGKNATVCPSASEFGIWNLVFGISLDLGSWRLELFLKVHACSCLDMLGHASNPGRGEKIWTFGFYCACSFVAKSWSVSLRATAPVQQLTGP